MIPTINDNYVHKSTGFYHDTNYGLSEVRIEFLYLTFWRRNYFVNFSTPVYKMWIIQEPNKLELWNKLHFEEEKTEIIYHV